MIKRNRKGDVTISTIILIVLGLAVLVMMIVGFTKGWDFIFGSFDNAPSDLQAFAKACVLYAQGSLSIDFCNYRLIGNELVNCKDDGFRDTLKEINTASLTCSNSALEACKTLAYGKPETKISGNAMTCGQFYKCTGTSTPACNTFDSSDKCKSPCNWAIPVA